MHKDYIDNIAMHKDYYLTGNGKIDYIVMHKDYYLTGNGNIDYIAMHEDYIDNIAMHKWLLPDRARDPYHLERLPSFE